MLDAWRARGDHLLDPVRFRLIEVLARRAQAHRGDARRILDDKVARLLAAYGEGLEKAGHASAPCEPADPRGTQGPAPRGALAELVDLLARHASAPGEGPTASDAASRLAPAPELKSLRYFKSTWSRLSADRWLMQSLAKVPENAGPLNSHHLVHRALALMRELSPEYLNRFMSHVDALSAIDQLNGAGASAGTSTRREESQRKAARGRST